MNNIYTL